MQNEKPEYFIPKTEAKLYQFRLKGHLNPAWSDWFDGLKILNDQNGETLLWGLVKDQSALFGILTKIQNLGLTLLSVNACDESQEEPEI